MSRIRNKENINQIDFIHRSYIRATAAQRHREYLSMYVKNEKDISTTTTFYTIDLFKIKHADTKQFCCGMWSAGQSHFTTCITSKPVTSSLTRSSPFIRQEAGEL